MDVKSHNCLLDTMTKYRLEIFLFSNVKNADDVRCNIIRGIWKCAAIKPELILHPFQVVVAANKAAVSETMNNMVTKTVFSEILYNLSLTKNISQSLSKFGIEKDNNFLICFLNKDNNQESERIVSQIDGEMCYMRDLVKFTDLKKLKDTYKLNKLDLKFNDDMLDIIISRMVTKNFVSH